MYANAVKSYTQNRTHKRWGRRDRKYQAYYIRSVHEQ